MPILLSCSCGQEIQVRDEFAGQQAKCPNCQGVFVIPHPGQAAAPRPQPSAPKPQPSAPRQRDYDAEEYESPPAKSGGGSLFPLFLLVGFLLLVGGSGAGLWYLAQQKNAKPTEEETPQASNTDQGKQTKDSPRPAPTPTPTPPKPMPMPTPMPTPMPMPMPMPVPASTGPWMGHQAPIYRLAFSQDSKWGYSASGGFAEKDGQLTILPDNTIRRWDATTGKEVVRLDLTDNGIGVVAFSPDGRLAAVVALGKEVDGTWQPDADNDIHIWDLRLRRERQKLVGHQKPPFCLQFSPGGARLLSGGPDNTVRLWDVQTGAEVKRLSGHRGAINAVAFSSDMSKAISGSGDRTVRLWDLETGVESRQFPAHQDIVWSVAFSPDGSKALSAGGNYYNPTMPGFVPGSRDYDIRLWDVATGDLIRRFRGHEDAVVSLAFTRDGRRFLSASEDKTARLWHVASGRQLTKYDEHIEAVRSVIFFPNQRSALSGDDSAALRIWPLPPDVRDFIAQLDDADQAKRLEAVQELKAYKSESVEAVPKLLKMIPGAEAAFQSELLDALDAIGKPSKEHAFLLAPLLLDKGFAPGRRYAMEQLLAMKEDAVLALDALHATIKDEDPTYRLKALQALGTIGPDAKAKALIDVIGMLADQEDAIRTAAKQTLDQFGPPDKEHLLAIRQFLKHKVEAIRAYAVTGLEQLGEEAISAESDLIGRLENDESVMIRQKSIQALMAINPKGRSLAMSLTEALEDESTTVALEAARALGKFDIADGTLPGLLTALQHKDPEISKVGGEAIANAPLKRDHVSFLILALNNPEPSVRLPIVEALIRLGPLAARAVSRLSRLLGESDGEVRARTLVALRKMGPLAIEAGPALAKLLTERDRELRLEVALTLVELGAEDAKVAIPFLVAALQITKNKDEKEIETRKKVAKILIKIGRPAVKELINAIDGRFFGGNPRTPTGLSRAEARFSALQVLGSIGKQGNYPEITRLLARVEANDGLREIREAARKLRAELQK